MGTTRVATDVGTGLEGLTEAEAAALARDGKANLVPAAPSRTIPQTLALYTEPYGDGHARWTGPTTGRKPEAYAHGHRYNARREAFRAHHHRAPHGPVTSTCTEPQCIAGDHLADRVIRDADAVLAQILPGSSRP